jgi:hypothetical protein
MSTIDRALIKHRLRSRTNPMAMLVAETQFLARSLNEARIEAERQSIEAERQRSRADALLWRIGASNRAAGLEPDETAPSPSLPLAERAARQQACMPSGHPEYLGTELPEADEELLGELAAGTWPEDEYEDVTADGDAV